MADRAHKPRGGGESLDLAAPSASLPRVRRRYHFGSSGFVYVFVTLLIALGAFNSQNNLLFWAFGFSLAMLVVSGLLSGAMLMGLRVTRERIGDAHAGDVLTIRYRVRNSNRVIPVFGLTIEENPPPAEATSGRLKRASRRSARTPAQESPPRIDPSRAFVPHIAPRETIIIESRTSAHRRGPVEFASFSVHTTFPFGIMRKSLDIHEPASTVILPTLAATDGRELESAALEGESARSSRIRGDGDEFHSLRDYTAGDNPRSIAWKASARRGHLLVKQSLAPSPLRLWIVLRLRVSAAQTEGFDERAISIAASMIEQARARSIPLGLAIPLTGMSVPPRADPAHFDRLLRELGGLVLGPADARGRDLPFPLAAASHRHACLCIHASGIDAAFGPANRVRHIGVLGETDTRARIPGRGRLISGDAAITRGSSRR